nr:MAG TPA: hypothetical protein [Caudoviricetes sp.]
MTPFDTLKSYCTTACHTRHACAEGYRAMLAAKNVSQLMAVWRANWEDIVESKYADIINDRLPALYPTLRKEMNAAGIYVNECPQTAPEFVFVLVTDYNTIVDINDYARCYVLGKATVRAWDHSQVYCDRCDQALIELHDHTYGHVSKGWVQADTAARLWTSTNASLYGSVTCEAHGGELRVSSYLKIEAYGDTKVFSKTDRNITLYGNAHIVV